MKPITFATATALALSLALSISASADAKSVTTRAAREVPISVDTMKEVTRVLSTDEFEGRAPGTPGEEKTVAYLADEFKKVGLQPGNNGSWFQDVPLVEITGKNYSPLAITGGATPLSLTLGTQFVGVSYREVPRSELKDSELVFVGYGINAPEKGWNDYAGLDMRGKTAVILINDPDYDAKDLTGPFNGRAMTYYGRWTYKFEEAARQGATGAIIVHDTYPAAYGWNVVESSWSGPQVHARTADAGANQTAFNGWVQKDQANAIFQAAGKDFASLSAAAKQPGFKAVPLGVKANLTFENQIRHFASKNVIGVLPGSKQPNEYVLYTAHWDHLGRCTPDATGDDICNGAIDNATGTAALAALAQAYVKAGVPDRSVVFLAVTSEESGLLGSEYYAANPVYPLAQTVGGVNMDALAMYGLSRDVTVIGGGKSQLDGYVDRVLAAQGRTKSPDAHPEKGFYYRSDHFSLAKRGVPMFNVGGGDDLVEGGRAAGEAKAREYTEKHYHQPSDEYDPNWDWRGVMQDLQMYYALGRALADSTDWPNWLPGDEFRAARDASRPPAK